MSIKAVIFDCFGVLVSEVAPFWLADHYSVEDATKIKSTLVHEADLGILSESYLFDKLSHDTNIPAIDIRDSWIKLARPNHDVINTTIELSKKYKLGFLSNAPSRFVRDVLSRLEIENLFEEIVISSEIGIAKPDIEIYLHIMNKMALKSDEAIFVDDNIKNVHGAMQAGIVGVFYEGHETLVSDLKSRNMI